MNIAVIGAPHTGKTQLVKALNAALGARGHQVFLIAADDAKILPGMFDLTLVCGLDWPVPVGEDAGQQLLARQTMDADLRASLARRALSYQVVYGANSQRLSNALRAVAGAEFAKSRAIKTAPYSEKLSPGKDAESASLREKWQSACDKCSDPVCEHRIFTQLIG